MNIEEKQTGRSRNWVITINNPDEKKWDIQNENKRPSHCTYIVGQLESGENQTPHIQGYIEFSEGVRIPSLKK